jgi:hypothetical protein
LNELLGPELIILVEDVPRWLATKETKKEAHLPGLIKGDGRYLMAT